MHSPPLRTVQSVIDSLPIVRPSPLPRPRYCPPPEGAILVKLALAVESMKRHTTDEGWQLMAGLSEADYALCGHNLLEPSVEVGYLLRKYRPSIVVMQDKREWDGLTAGGRKTHNSSERFKDVDKLKFCPDIFKVTVLKDAQSNPEYHSQSAEEIGCHAWIVYYHPDIVCRLAPYVRRHDLIRVYHTVDVDVVPKFHLKRQRARDTILSGAISSAYPLRTSLLRACDRGEMKGTDVLPHPGYHRRGSETPRFLRTLADYKVAICTSSRYGYALRKIIEATACGCRVITDLPVDDVLPFIDGNLTRISPSTSPREVAELVKELCSSYDDDVQRDHATFARWYDFRLAGQRLAKDIDLLRAGYNS